MNSDNRGPGFSPADILLPKNADMTKWAVVACDQFTSQPEYWEEAKRIVGGEPSSLKLILPEAELTSPSVDEEITSINRTMREYLDGGIFSCLENALIYVERVQSNGLIRHGLVGKIDLECYDFTPGTGTLVRPTEATVPERIPPRVRVRENASIELPHVMVLIDDPRGTVIERLTAQRGQMQMLYNFDLMLGGGHVIGRLLNEEQKNAVAASLKELVSPEIQEKKYGLKDAAPLLYAIGDGNHSLAAAKRCYEEQKAAVPESEWEKLPSRYALVELVNIHDDALKFEPIHRVVFDVDPEDLLRSLLACYPDAYEETPGCCTYAGKRGFSQNQAQDAEACHRLRYLTTSEEGVICVPHPAAQLTVATLQTFLDAYVKEKGGRMDYIHGEETVRKLVREQQALGFLLPAMKKEEFFKTLMADSVLPRKTFSMGHAEDKRYYVEARRIR